MAYYTITLPSATGTLHDPGAQLNEVGPILATIRELKLRNPSLRLECGEIAVLAVALLF